MANFCVYCGAQLYGNGAFCHACGKRKDVAATSAEPLAAEVVMALRAEKIASEALPTLILSKPSPARFPQRIHLDKTLPSVFFVFIAAVWCWFSKFHSLSGSNGAEAFGANLVSVGLPVLLLFFTSRALYRGLKREGAIAPYMLTISSICGSGALLVLFDLPTTRHFVGAVSSYILFSVATVTLYVVASKQQHRLNEASTVAPEHQVTKTPMEPWCPWLGRFERLLLIALTCSVVVAVVGLAILILYSH
jgi:hypothetical protein